MLLPRLAFKNQNLYDTSMDEVILEREALKLPANERALLADALLSSLDDEAVHEIEAAWAKEAEKRLAAYKAGKIQALDGPSVLRELRNRYSK